jgi:hypothetical protein
MTLQEAKQAIRDSIGKAAQELSMEDYNDLVAWVEDELSDEMDDIQEKADGKPEADVPEPEETRQPPLGSSFLPVPDAVPAEAKAKPESETEPA